MSNIIDTSDDFKSENFIIEGWEGQDQEDLLQRSQPRNPENTETHFSYDNSFRAVTDLEQIEEVDGTVHLINNQERRFAILRGGQDNIDAIGFTNNSEKIIVTAGKFDDEQLIKIWDLEFKKVTDTNEETDFGDLEYNFNSLSFSGDVDNGTIAATTEDGVVHFFDLKGNQQVGRTIAKAGVSFTYVSTREERTALVGTTGDQYEVYIHNLKTNELISAEGSQTSTKIESVTLNQNGTRLAALRTDNTISIWNSSGKKIIDKDMEKTILDIRFDKDDHYLSFVFQKESDSKSNEEEIYVSTLNLETEEENPGDRRRIRTIASNTEILSTELDPSGSFIAIVFNSIPDLLIEDQADYPKTVILTTATGDELLALDTAHKDDIHSMTFHSSGKLLATIGKEGSIKLWELGGLDELMDRACDWLQWYLNNPSADLTDEQRKLCPP
ncbi:MAG: WD40 repeat domain-containing protein [Cyanothece sp. SIO2G6]|nr:WD40 repeat domain-containing protein [Cyanothece sp. SIO2G6]